jgi:ribonuclease T2
MTPSEALLAHEWTKHGACMAPTPESYFRTARMLWGGLRWPDFDRLARRRNLTAGQVREEFSQANRLWEPEAVGLVLSERGWLEGLRLCYDMRFRPAACEARRFGPADSAPVQIWRGL